MGYQTNSEAAAGVTTATTTHDGDPGHVYSSVRVEGPLADWFERNAVRVTFDKFIAVEADEVGGALVLCMIDADGRALAAALTAHYAARDAQ